MTRSCPETNTDSRQARRPRGTQAIAQSVSKDAGEAGRTGTSGLRLCLRWLRLRDLSRRAVLKLGRVRNPVLQRRK
jgi:hypothetical protein